MPVYNTAAYLAECLDSIVRQTIDKEIIIVDDGSTDTSLDLALVYAKKYPFISIIHGSNKGLSAARNQGVRLATGEFLFFVDSDDYLLGDELAEIYALAQAYQVDLVKLQSQAFLDKNPSEIHPYPPTSPNLTDKSGELYTGRQFFTALAFKLWIPGVCWTLFRREFLLNNSYHFVAGVKAEDQIFYTEILTHRPDVKVLELSSTIYNYRFRQNSLSRSENDVDYVIDLHRIIDWLDAWQSYPFNDVTKKAINIIQNHLRYAIEIDVKKMSQVVKNRYQIAKQNYPTLPIRKPPIF